MGLVFLIFLLCALKNQPWNQICWFAIKEKQYVVIFFLLFSTNIQTNCSRGLKALLLTVKGEFPRALVKTRREVWFCDSIYSTFIENLAMHFWLRLTCLKPPQIWHKLWETDINSLSNAVSLRNYLHAKKLLYTLHQKWIWSPQRVKTIACVGECYI